MAYLLLFLSALLAATIVPAQSETVLAGRYLEHFHDKRWFPVKTATLERAQAKFQRYGWWSLLLSWVPIIGDPLTVVVGLMRMPLLPFVLVVAVEDIGRCLPSGDGLRVVSVGFESNTGMNAGQPESQVPACRFCPILL